MNRTIISLIFLVTVLVLCAGAFGIGRWVAPANLADVGRRPGWTPPGSASPVPAARGVTATPTSLPTQAPNTVPAPTPSRTRASATPTIEIKDQSGQTPTAVVSPTPTVTATSATATRRAEYAFELVRPVRNSSGDCPGSYVLGSVIDQTGKPHAGCIAASDRRVWQPADPDDQEGRQRVGTVRFSAFWSATKVLCQRDRLARASPQSGRGDTTRCRLDCRSEMPLGRLATAVDGQRHVDGLRQSEGIAPTERGALLSAQCARLRHLLDLPF